MEELWLCILRFSDAMSAAACSSPLLARVCAIRRLEASCHGVPAELQTTLQVEEVQAPWRLRILQALGRLQRAEELVRELPSFQALTSRERKVEPGKDPRGSPQGLLLLALLRAEAVRAELSETLKTLKMRGLMAQWEAFVDQYGNNGLYQGHHRICT
ncbi:unnamed protein product [Durusdinium trenchii]|uniref:Uncharacterized protein n=1 Tax=Durusdinium trenchii TaxID=1381693 RepID=A0ABP0R3L5_9DINO